MKVFYCYSSEDERLRNELEKHLSMLRRQRIIEDWHFRKIISGKEWESVIDKNLDSSQIILLLVSPDFMNSDYCYDIEMKRAMDLRKAGQARVIPIILRAVDWNSAPFSKLQALPKDAKPVTSWANIDEAFYDISMGIRKACEEIREMTSASVVLQSKSTRSISIKREQLEGILESGMYCSQCGAKVGRKSECTGLFASHDFRKYSGFVYCSRCGIKPGEKTECIGLYSSHDFKIYRGVVYCNRCGVIAGKRTSCIDIFNVLHDFSLYRDDAYCSRCGAKVGERTSCIGFYTSHDFRL